MAMILISHDFGVVAHTCDNVAVMYGGFIVEYGSVAEISRDLSTPTRVGWLHLSRAYSQAGAI